MLTPLEQYREDLRNPDFHPDAAQEAAVLALQRVYNDLRQPPQAPGVWQRWFRRPVPVPRGLYLWGGPGRGKTYLVDRFYESLPFAEKHRIHFHRFMLGVHEQLNKLPKTPNPLQVVARTLASRLRLLCLDEFHVTDIADAMLLDGLLKAMFHEGIVLVTTSNLHPDELYRDGLQRERFLHAIDQIKDKLEVMHLDSSMDYRSRILEHSGTYRVFQDHEQALLWLEQYLQQLSPVAVCRQVEVPLNGRIIPARATGEDVVWFQFRELCEQPRSARDYLELARLYHTLLLDGVPVFGEGGDEAARRFMHLIDALYDQQVKLVMTAGADPEHLYPGGRLATGFARTASRLQEMKLDERRLELAVDEKRARVQRLEDRLNQVRNVREEAAVQAGGAAETVVDQVLAEIHAASRFPAVGTQGAQRFLVRVFEAGIRIDGREHAA